MLLIASRFLSVWAGTPFPIDLVSSDSMSPILMEGDIVAWTPTNIQDINVGDVVVFKSHIRWPDEKIVVHRVTKIIYDRSGNPLLETKGDNNDWTDQAGPHIPEPYVREKNLMGKTVSIGQMPLKIPFIGYLGVWINNGLRSISQPTQNKESLSYVGIFAPFTISLVLLIVLFFILPEKAKTIKEKIHLNIFGRKPLKLKSTIIMFLIAYIIFFTVIHAFAYDSTTASVGIRDRSPDSSLNFGRLSPGGKSSPQAIPVINPSTMPVKGVIFGTGGVSDKLSLGIFDLGAGETKNAFIHAIAPKDAVNGSFQGNVMIYSSPFWLLFSDDFILSLLNWNAQATIFVLDFICAIFLTFITILTVVTLSFASEKIAMISIDRSWQHPAKIYLKKQTTNKFKNFKIKLKRSIQKWFLWIINIEFIEEKLKGKYFNYIKKPIIASFFTIPIIFFFEDKILALFISIVVTGLIAYLISCKMRYKLIITTIITMSLALIHMGIQSNLIILSKQLSTLELFALSSGAVGVYLLLFSLLLVPFAILSWFIARLFRNLKERKDPLLSLEGSCDL